MVGRDSDSSFDISMSSLSSCSFSAGVLLLRGGSTPSTSRMPMRSVNRPMVIKTDGMSDTSACSALTDFSECSSPLNCGCSAVANTPSTDRRCGIMSS